MRLLLCCSICTFISANTIAQISEFGIYKSGDRVGKIQVSRAMQGDRVVYDMGSTAEIRVIWKQRVSTSARTEYRGNTVTSCHSSIRVNESVRDSSSMRIREGDDHCFVYPGYLDQCATAEEWTTARMYFEEPINATRVFVESVLQNCLLEPTGGGGYTLTFPNKTRNHYSYSDGILQEIQVKRPFFDLVFRRIGESAMDKLSR